MIHLYEETIVVASYLRIHYKLYAVIDESKIFLLNSPIESMNDIESVNEHFCIAHIFRIDYWVVNKCRFVICFEMIWW